MKKLTWSALFFTIFVISTSFAQKGQTPAFHHWDRAGEMARKNPGPENPFQFRSFDRILDDRKELNLTDEQIEKIRQLTFEFRTSQVEKRANVEKSSIVVEHLESDKSASEQSVMEAIDNLARARADLEKARYHFRKELHSILTPKQLEKLEEMLKAHREELREGWPGPDMENDFEGDDSN